MKLAPNKSSEPISAPVEFGICEIRASSQSKRALVRVSQYLGVVARHPPSGRGPDPPHGGPGHELSCSARSAPKKRKAEAPASGRGEFGYGLGRPAPNLAAGHAASQGPLTPNPWNFPSAQRHLARSRGARQPRQARQIAWPSKRDAAQRSESPRRNCVFKQHQFEGIVHSTAYLRVLGNKLAFAHPSS